MSVRRFFTLFSTVTLVLVGVSAQASSASTRQQCLNLAFTVPLPQNDAVVGQIVFHPSFCFDGTSVMALDARTDGRAESGWTYRGAVHVRYFGELGTPYRSVWESVQLCHGGSAAQCVGSHESVFASIWLAVHGSGNYRFARTVRLVNS